MLRSPAALLLLILLVGNAQAGPRTNLVAIVTDDQGRWAMGTYGNRDIRTPNMDRMGREGAVFENAFVATPVLAGEGRRPDSEEQL